MNSNFKRVYEKSELILTKDIPQFEGEAAEGTLILAFTYQDVFTVRIYLRHVKSNEKLLFEDRVYGCKITRLPEAATTTMISQQFDIVFVAIDQVVDKIRKDVANLGTGKNLGAINDLTTY